MIKAAYRLLGDPSSSSPNRRLSPSSSARWIVAAVAALAVLVISSRSYQTRGPGDRHDVLRDVRPAHPDSTYKNPHAIEAQAVTDRSEPVHIVAFCRLWTTHAFGGMAQVAFDRFQHGIKHHNCACGSPLAGRRR